MFYKQLINKGKAAHGGFVILAFGRQRQEDLEFEASLEDY
jgi:hypothetical protein